ncbi:MAG: hypothetical protein QI199_02895 [Candidatus Korarchaeota archaeon]|nr:hypothetical protein [Candidatus Korarchaeota archaeon]
MKRKLSLSIMTSLLVILLLILSLLNPAWVFGKGYPYLISTYKMNDIDSILKKLEKYGIPYTTLLRVKGSLPSEVLMATDEGAFIESLLSGSGNIQSKVDLENFHLAVDVLGMDRATMAMLFGYNYLLSSPQDCIVSKPLFEALKKAYGKKMGDWIEVDVYTGVSHLNLSCRMISTFPEKNLMLSYIVAMDRGYLESAVYPLKDSHWFNQFADEVILVYVDGVDELREVEKAVGCSDCLVPIG